MRSAPRPIRADAAAAAGAAAAAVLAAVFPRRARLDHARARRRAGASSARRGAGRRPFAPASGAARRRPPLDRRGRGRATRDAVDTGTVPKGAGPLARRGRPRRARDLARAPAVVPRLARPAPSAAATRAGYASFRRPRCAAVRTATEGRTRAQTRATWAWARNARDALERDRRRADPAPPAVSERDAARALMYLNMALSDATIACWDAKLTTGCPGPRRSDSTIDLVDPSPQLPFLSLGARDPVRGRRGGARPPGARASRRRSTAWRARRPLRAYGPACTTRSTTMPARRSAGA